MAVASLICGHIESYRLHVAAVQAIKAYHEGTMGLVLDHVIAYVVSLELRYKFES